MRELDASRRAALVDLAGRLGHSFADILLLHQALTHKSITNEKASATHNEPLEFLGDAVLGFLVADLLHQHSPNGPEGEKSRARAALVSAASLAPRAAALGLSDLLVMGRGEEKTGGRRKERLSANAFEAVVAAIYLDGGMEAAARFVSRTFGGLTALESLSGADQKSELQERLQGEGRALPEYVVTTEEGPAHRKLFHVACRIEGVDFAVGTGHSKKVAQQEAASRALERLRGGPSQGD
jgi:ribonuclease-3